MTHKITVFFGLFSSFGILENRKHDVSETVCFRPQVKGEKTPTQLGPLKRANLNSKGPNRVGVFCPLQLRTETSNFRNVVFSIL
jgi:hypothetical protein